MHQSNNGCANPKEPTQKKTLRNRFRQFAQATATAMGSPWAFAIALTSILIWALTGPVFHFSDSWQLVINTGTTIITFLMVFVIQNTQNRDARAMHLKLDELIRGVRGARTRLVDLETLSDEELDRLQQDFERLRDRAARVKQEPARSHRADESEEQADDGA